MHDYFANPLIPLVMKTENDLNSAILEITMKIKNKYPELSKYLAEMPVTIPDIKTPEINNKTLQDYYNSLILLLKKYSINHETNI